MLAAEIWHWWIGVVLAIVGIIVLVVLTVGYLKTVSAQKYPDRKQKVHADL